MLNCPFKSLLCWDDAPWNDKYYNLCETVPLKRCFVGLNVVMKWCVYCAHSVGPERVRKDYEAIFPYLLHPPPNAAFMLHFVYMFCFILVIIASCLKNMHYLTDCKLKNKILAWWRSSVLESFLITVLLICIIFGFKNVH